MMKMAFRFILKALVVLKIFKFFLDILVMKRKELKIRKIWLISKFMTSQPGKQTITMHILPNISRSKGNQTTKFGSLIQYIKRNILQKIMQKVREGDSFQTSFSFLKSLQLFLFCSLISIYFDSSQLGIL